jgi:hypothetical protein
MSTNAYIGCLNTCLDFLDPSLQPDEDVIQIEQGQTLYGHNTCLFYLVRIATFQHMSGNTPTNPRYCVLRVTSNAPHEVTLAKMSDWQPL